MHNGRKLVADTFCDVYDLLEPWIDDDFHDFSSFVPDSKSICVVGRKQVVEHTAKFIELCSQDITMVFANSAEGSTTQIAQLEVLGLTELVKNGQLLLLSGGRMPRDFPHVLHEHFFMRILAYDENLAEIDAADLQTNDGVRPYKFLFLNGRARPHRKYLLEKLQLTGLLDQALWTMLDGRPCSNRDFSLVVDSEELMSTNTPITVLPSRYEVPRYRDRQLRLEYPHQNCKIDLFNNEWGEIYLHRQPYHDSYFSLITETVYQSEHSFFTEKIAKPLAIGHPWICASNRGFYRDLRNLGFRTFDTLIDESFDQIDHNQSRLDRIVTVIEDLCQQDLGAFVREAHSICKYNQLHLRDVIQTERATFAQRFFTFIDNHA